MAPPRSKKPVAIDQDDTIGKLSSLFVLVSDTNVEF